MKRCRLRTAFFHGYGVIEFEPALLRSKRNARFGAVNEAKESTQYFPSQVNGGGQRPIPSPRNHTVCYTSAMEIERKFLVKEMPDLSGITPIRYERYFLTITEGVEERIQKTNERYTYEKKVAVDELTRSTELKQITAQEFEELKAKSGKAILRDSYLLSSGISIKIYHGDYEGLVRAEVEFASTDEAKNYKPESWMGNEITDSPLGRDSKLLELDSRSVLRLIKVLL